MAHELRTKVSKVGGTYKEMCRGLGGTFKGHTRISVQDSHPKGKWDKYTSFVVLSPIQKRISMAHVDSFQVGVPKSCLRVEGFFLFFIIVL